MGLFLVRVVGVALVMVGALACTDEATPSPDPPVGGAGGQGGEGGSTGGAGGCQPGQLEVEGECVDAGLPTEGCAPGHLLDDQDECQPAGVPAAWCGEGFESDGDYGCRAILPAAPCESGQMALPGETTCREVAPCADGTWGDIPVESNTQFVDQSYLGGDGDGTQAKPWPTVLEAVAAADPGAIVAIAAGSYVGEVDIADQPVRLWGRCPGLVELVGTGVHVLEIGAGADGTEIRDLALTGSVGWSAIAVHGSAGVIFDRVWLHDALGSRGFDITEDSGSATGVILTRSLVERTRTNAIMVWGAAIEMSDSVVRDTQPSLNSGIARGLNVAVNTSTETPSTGTVERSVFVRNRDLGIGAFGADLTVDSVLIRDTAALDDGDASHGLYLQTAVGVPAVATVRGSVIEGTEGFGVSARGAAATFEGLTVRNTGDEPATGGFGYGVTVMPSVASPHAASASLRFSLIDESHYVGVAAFSSEVTLHGVRVRDTQPRPSDDRSGIGGWAGPGTDTAPATVALVGSVMEGNHEAGWQANGAALTVDRSVIHGTHPGPANGLNGAGLHLWSHATVGPTSLTMTGSVVDGNASGGIILTGAQGTIEQSVVTNTASTAAGGLYGDGISVTSYGGQRGTLILRTTVLEAHHRTGVFVYDAEALIEGSIVRTIAPLPADGTLGDALSAISATEATSLAVRATRLEAATRAGISSFGASVSLQSSLLLCNPIALNGESHEGFAAAFEDLGDNRCTCESGDDPTCKILSSSIAPPTALADPDADAPPEDEGL
ncbi:MAG: hypothetical protein JRI68_16345 [Deltaproteobacteria bacterium]|nr:hypothetical protein [Deltaproteobacteria bacterium]